MTMKNNYCNTKSVYVNNLNFQFENRLKRSLSIFWVAVYDIMQKSRGSSILVLKGTVVLHTQHN